MQTSVASKTNFLMIYRNFNFFTFIFAWTIVGFLTFLSFIAFAAFDEGTIGTNPIWIVLAKSFYIFRFPFHNIFWPLMIKNDFNFSKFFFLGLFLNSLLYALLVERLLYLIKRKKVTTNGVSH